VRAQPREQAEKDALLVLGDAHDAKGRDGGSGDASGRVHDCA
jgi:hypothetical protein